MCVVLEVKLSLTVHLASRLVASSRTVSSSGPHMSTIHSSRRVRRRSPIPIGRQVRRQRLILSYAHDDPPQVLNKNYKEVPWWWYIILLALSFFAGTSLHPCLALRLIH